VVSAFPPGGPDESAGKLGQTGVIMTTTMGAKNRSANLMDRRRISWNSRCNDGQKRRRNV